MKRIKLGITSLLLIGIFCLSHTIVNAQKGCTQSHIDCPDDAGLYLMCSGPTTNTTCYAGGCGAPVKIVNCSDNENEE